MERSEDGDKNLGFGQDVGFECTGNAKDTRREDCRSAILPMEGRAGASDVSPTKLESNAFPARTPIGAVELRPTFMMVW